MLPQRRRSPGAGGSFVIEVLGADLRRLPPGDTVRTFTLTPTHLGFDECDVANQAVVMRPQV